MITLTLKEIRKHELCKDGWKKLTEGLGGIKKYGEETPITFEQIYDINGYDDTLWCLRVTEERYHHLWRHFAVDCAKQVEHLMGDERSKAALIVARSYASGEATGEELPASWDAAWSAAWSASWDTARSAARDAQIKLLLKYCELGERPANSVELLKGYINDQTN